MPNNEYVQAQYRGLFFRNILVLHYLGLALHVVANGFDSVYYQGYEYPELCRLIHFLREIGCEEPAGRIERGRDIYYRGRTDLMTFDIRDAVGLDGNHLTEEEMERLYQLDEGMYGSDDSLLATSMRPFMEYVKAHPELLEVRSPVPP